MFRFENFWAEQSDFKDIVQECWNSIAPITDAACTISAKFKALRLRLKNWSKHDRARCLIRVAAKVVWMEERRARLRETAAGWRRGDHSARKKRRCG